LVLAEIATVLAPLFLCAGIGFAWARSGRIFDAANMGDLIAIVGLPCLTYATLTKLAVEPATFVRVAGYYLVSLAAFGAVGIAALRAAGLELRTYLPPMMFSNTGNMGLPVCLFAFGEVGLALAVCIYLTNAVLNYVVGVAIFAGHLSVRSITHNVLVWSAAAALATVAAGIEPPRWLINTAVLVGAVPIPFMVVALGAAVARLEISDLPRTFALSVLRQATGFLAGWGTASLFGLEGVERGILILMSSMPAAVVNYLFALRHGRNPEQVASMVMATTLLSYAMLPFVLLVVLPGGAP
jgi:hypothetical protein